MSDTPSANQDKLTLYSSTGSQWAYVAHLTLIEKGYKPVEYDVVNVDLMTAQNLEPEYVKINPHGTIPSLNHPSFKTPLMDSVDILEYLDRSRPAATVLNTGGDMDFYVRISKSRCRGSSRESAKAALIHHVSFYLVC
ncbi:hypothetical protein BJY00DRAFT_280628 [Aspergillus carlsbadensis]|nr:hypothetical protein BJY00DRAFT_280628 [Aspergillus carlsbadensis]